MNADRTLTGRIGPNAIIRVAESLRQHWGETETRRLFALAEADAFLDAPPHSMVNEQAVVKLHAAVREQMGGSEAGFILNDAGLRTGDYLLAHRIPRLAQRVLKRLPPSLAATLLIKAIKANAWTFVGSGRFSSEAGPPRQLVIADNPLCRDAVAEEPICAFYTGTFQRLFATLVSPKAVVTETACSAIGAQACRFAVRW